ncbi:MAG TPA: FAD-binding oxidoreductase [Elainellaceae cyanobacterium]
MTQLQIKTSQDTNVPLDSQALEDFRQHLQGEVLQDGDSGYEDARTIWNGMIDRRPGAIARCTGTADVIHAVNFARRHNLLLSVRGGGHNVAGNALCDNGLTIDLSLMKGIHVDPTSRIARVQPGVCIGELDHETQVFGLANPNGIVSLTGIAGLTLGGGFGWLSRKYGLTCDNLLSVDVVTADGEFLTASETENADLFWGLRGGGGNFGIVTSFEYRLHQVGPEVMGGKIIYPFEKADEVLRFYRDFAAAAPYELGTLAFLKVAPPSPAIPKETHGKLVVGIAVCYAGSVEEGQRIIQPLKDFGSPIMDGISSKPFAVIQSMFDAGQQPGNHYYWKSEYLPGLSDEAIVSDRPSVIATSIHYAEHITSPMTGILIFQLGGAISRVDEEAMAASHRDAEFVININTAWENPSESDRHIQWTRDFWQAMRSQSTGGVYVNFLSRDDGADRVQAAYGKATYDRLVQLKNQYDPTNLFRINQNIQPTDLEPGRV